MNDSETSIVERADELLDLLTRLLAERPERAEYQLALEPEPGDSLLRAAAVDDEAGIISLFTTEE